MYFEIQYFGCLQLGIVYIVGIVYLGYSFFLNVVVMFDIGVDVG